jgi:hypothetical protein
MSSESTAEVPTMQRLYNRIWTLAAVALVFFTLSYVVWGILTVVSQG